MGEVGEIKAIWRGEEISFRDMDGCEE